MNNLIREIEFLDINENNLIKGIEFDCVIHDDYNLIRGIYYDSWYDVDCLNIIPDMYQVNIDTGEFRNKQTQELLKQFNYKSTEICSNSYKGVHLININGERMPYLAHRVILSNFVPFKRIDQTQVNHIDYIKNHNYLDNLEWTSPKENTHHAMDGGNWKRGELVYNSTFTDNEVEVICESLEKGFKYKDILIKIGKEITDNNLDYIGNIKRGITFKHISKNYTFPEISYPFSKFSEDQIRHMCRLISEQKKFREIASELDIDVSTKKDAKIFGEIIRLIRNRKRYKHISKDFNW